MEKEMKKTGIDVLGDAPWGTHFCNFYKTKQDLIDILVPYFKTGLENNEFCMWVTSEPLRVEEAKNSLKNKIKSLDKYFKKGQIEILDYSQWYTRSGKFEADKVLQSWAIKEQQALKRGFNGLRLTGNTFWLKKREWKNFAEYEKEINNVIGKHKMLAICSYPLDKCGASELIDVVSSHQFALIKRGGKWEAVESSEHKKTEEALRKAHDELEMQVEKRTIELTKSNLLLKKEITERKRAEEKIKQSLKEKELLLNEIHHRVKNNLQIISSLLDMSSMQTDNEEVIDLCRGVQAKIRTMALIHSQLHRTAQFDRINMESFIHEQVAYLSQVFATKKRSITPIIDHLDIYLTIDKAIPCALVLNEVISNAFKHGFKGKEKGTVRISLKKSAHDTVFIRVKDDDVGIPEEIDINKAESLGLNLIRNLIQEQLNGKIQVKRINGTEIIIRFKFLDKEERHG